MAWPVEEFLSGLVHLRCSTVCGYRSQLRLTCASWVSMGCEEPGQLSESVLLAWCHVRRKAVRPGAFFSQLRLVARFLRWLVRRGYLLSNPLPGWLLHRYRAFYSPRLVPGELATRNLVAKVSKLKGKTKQRDLAMVEVLYGCGLRRGELSGLNLSDLRGDELRVRGKFGTERVVPVGRVASTALRAYLDGERAEYLRRLNPFEPALFLGRSGRRLGMAGIGYLFRERLAQPITAHQLRHACATHMLHNGASIVVLRDLLGHKCISTTRIYTEVKVQDIRKALSQFHPRC